MSDIRPACNEHCAYCGQLTIETWDIVGDNKGTKCLSCGVGVENEKVWVFIESTKETLSYWKQIPEGTLLILHEHES